MHQTLLHSSCTGFDRPKENASVDHESVDECEDLSTRTYYKCAPSQKTLMDSTAATQDNSD